MTLSSAFQHGLIISLPSQHPVPSIAREYIHDLEVLLEEGETVCMMVAVIFDLLKKL